MIADDTFQRLLLKEIAELRAEKMEKLAAGQWAASKTASDVGMEAMKRIWFLKALDEVEDLMEKVQSDMHK